MIERENDMLGSKTRLHAFIERYNNLISYYIDRQFKEEDANGESNEQYNYIILTYTLKLVNIISYFAKFIPYNKIYKDYNLKGIKELLGKRNINFNQILELYNLPKVGYDDLSVDNSIIGVTPIVRLSNGVMVTTFNTNLDNVIIPFLEPFNVYTGYVDGEDVSLIEEVQELRTFVCQGFNSSVTLDFSDFIDMHPVILIPATVDLLDIREESNLFSVKDGYIKSANQFEIGGILMNCYVYYVPTLSDAFSYVLQLDYSIL